MRRREFVAAVAAAAFVGAARAAEVPQDVRIVRAVGFDVTSRRSKVAGRNAQKEVHGDQSTDRMVRLYTNTGAEGFGHCRADEQDVAKLIGKPLTEFYRASDTAMSGPLGAGTMPLWDLLGKLTQQPVYALLGGKGAEQVPVYDGSIYFADLLPQYADKWEDRFRTEIDMGLEIGHRAFKIKIGRGAKWMRRDEGNARDVAVVKLIREHAGPDVLLGVDANNGYDLAGAKRFLEQSGDANLAFVEELFEETVDDCLALKAFIQEHSWATLVADGETQSQLDVFKPFISAQAIELYQGDMNHFGVEGILTEAAWARETGLRVAPHNWGSLIGYYAQLHVGRAIDNFYRAEHDPLTTDVLVAEGYARKDGLATVPSAPGFGLSIDEDRFASGAKVRFDLS
ncbi:MAG: enolase C-terminal domain-like protein [Planctomycetia bacterium]|nr:enolase C-terminal domain-like protein [Planctomycetia bacterium]